MKRSEFVLIFGLSLLTMALPNVDATDKKPQPTKKAVPAYLNKNNPVFMAIKDRVITDLKESARKADPESVGNKALEAQVKTWPQDRINDLQDLFAKSIDDYTAQTNFDTGTFMLVFDNLAKQNQKTLAVEYNIRVQNVGDSRYVAEFWEDGLAVNSEAHALAWARELVARFPDDKNTLEEVKKTYANTRKAINTGKQQRYTKVMALLYTAKNGGTVTFVDPFQPLVDFAKTIGK